MSEWIFYALVIIGFVAAWLIYQTYFTRHGAFWQLVAKYPDAAVIVLDEAPHSILNSVPSERASYSGPFFFMDSSGHRHTVYIQADSIDILQERYADAIRRLMGIKRTTN